MAFVGSCRCGVLSVIYSKIVGVSFVPKENFEGMFFHEMLTLVPEPENPSDPFAVRFEREGGKHIGYVRAFGGLNREIFEALKTRRVVAFAKEFTGDWQKDKGLYYPKGNLFGINVQFTILRNDAHELVRELKT